MLRRFQFFFFVLISSSVGLAQTAIYSPFPFENKTKQQNRIIKRYIDPSTIFIGGGTGLFFGKSKIIELSDALKSWARESWTIGAQVEIGLKNNFFYEFDYSMQKYYQSNRFTLDWMFLVGTANSTFVGHKISAGAGYRVIFKKSNFNIITVKAGIATTINFSQKGSSGTGFGGDYSVLTGNYFSYSKTSTTVHNVMPSIYFGLTKDFKLSKNLMISLGYRYDLGFVTSEQTIITYEHDGHPQTQTVTSVINGTASTYTIGLKYGFVSKSKKTEK